MRVCYKYTASNSVSPHFTKNYFRPRRTLKELKEEPNLAWD